MVNRTTQKTTFKHGDMIYLVAERENIFPSNTNSTLDIKSDTPLASSSYASPKVGSFQLNNATKLNSTSSTNTDIKEDEVDVQLDKMDGRIPRKRDPQLY